MNILLTNSTDIFAGGEDYVLILAKYLAKRGHSVCVSALPGHLLLRKCESAGIDTLPIEYTGMGRVFEVAGVLRTALKSRRVDIVHSNANYDRTVAAIAAIGTHARHVAGVHSAHSIQHNVTHWLRNRFGIDQFIADAEAVRDVLMHEDGIDGSRITVVPIGVEHDTEEVRRTARAATRAALHIDERTLVVGNVARLVPFKGHRFLLETIAAVTRARTDVLFLLVGDGELLDQLRAQAHDLGIEQYLRFLGFRDDLDALYPAFDIYCHSSLELAAEAFPLAILRALACGLPVACTNVGGIGLMVEEGKSGHLTKPEDPASLAAAVLDIAGDPAKRKSMGKASFDLFLRKFHASAMAAHVEAVYNKII